MDKISRRMFLQSSSAIAFSLSSFPAFAEVQQKKPIVMTVLGPIDPTTMGNTLVHEHILVDFIGAKLTTSDRWNRDEVMDKALPFIDDAKAAGCKTFIDCTPNYVGRDVTLLTNISKTAKINIISNTGYYGGSDQRFLPDHAFTESADALANRWAGEFKFGIDNTGVKPGFIKISVNPEALSDISKKLIMAAGATHLRTGLTIVSHTGPAIAAFEQIQILKKSKISPSAFVWAHSQNEKDPSNYVTAAKEGAWISLDGLKDENVDQYAEYFLFMKKENVLSKLLISHDAGWYEPGKPGGGEFRAFTTLFKKLIPMLKEKGVVDNDIRQLTQVNPMNAFSISVKRLK
jgi:phosphotriesterase-related protein